MEKFTKIKEMKILLKELQKLKEKVLGILFYGSCAENKQYARSDIDVCIVVGTRNEKKLKEIFKETLRISGINEKYDIKIFEYMSLYLKAEIIEKGKVIFAKNISELFEYFYFFRKLWQDQSINRIEKKIAA